MHNTIILITINQSPLHARICITHTRLGARIMTSRETGIYSVISCKLSGVPRGVFFFLSQIVLIHTLVVVVHTRLRCNTFHFFFPSRTAPIRILLDISLPRTPRCVRTYIHRRTHDTTVFCLASARISIFPTSNYTRKTFRDFLVFGARQDQNNNNNTRNVRKSKVFDRLYYHV